MNSLAAETAPTFILFRVNGRKERQNECITSVPMSVHLPASLQAHPKHHGRRWAKVVRAARPGRPRVGHDGTDVNDDPERGTQAEPPDEPHVADETRSTGLHHDTVANDEGADG